MSALAGVLLLGIAAGLAWSNQVYLKALAITWVEAVWPKVLNAEAEHVLQPGQIFYECFGCPEMVVVPAGEFVMGSPKQPREQPQHKVSIRQPLAVSRFEITFDEWDACVTLGGCARQPWDQGWGRGRRPVINVSWDDAQQFVAWLSRRTGKSYRLLSEPEWEYAAAAGGDDICKDRPPAWREDFKGEGPTEPVGSCPANRFSLHDMHGSVWEWVQDCYQGSHDGAPTDGSPQMSVSCTGRVVRGGRVPSFGTSRMGNIHFFTEESRLSQYAQSRVNGVGVRIGRTLNP